MIRLSIIIPIYNVEPFVERCLRSLEDQNIPGNEYEIICINDGSPDNSREIVIQLQKEFNNIILLDQDNQGVSCARNAGIDKAVGRYLMFIDSDDYIESYSLERILKSSEEQSAQVSIPGFSFLNVDGSIREMINYEEYEGKFYLGIEAYSLARGNGETDADRIWGMLFETDFLSRNNLRYLPNVPYLEDGEFIDRTLCLAECCIFVRGSFYQRTTRPGSATNSNLFFSEKATKGFLLAATNLKRFQLDQSLNEKQKEFLNQPIAQFVILAVNSSLGCGMRKKLLATAQSLNKLNFRRIQLDGCIKIYRIYGKAYNLSIYLCAIVLIIYPRMNRKYLSNLFRRVLKT